VVAEIKITGDLATGAVQVSGPIADMRIVHWMLDEAKRVCERLANQRDSSNGHTPQIVAPDIQLPPLSLR
jgi:hypothetical protein